MGCRMRSRGKINLETASTALSIFQRAIEQGYGGEDFSVVARSSAEKPARLTPAGLTVNVFPPLHRSYGRMRSTQRVYV